MKILKEYIFITIGVCFDIISLEYFFFPNSIANGGVTGLALIVNSLFKINTGIVMLICNVILFILAFVFIGGRFGIKSVYAAFTLTFGIVVFEKFLVSMPVTDNLILASIFGSLILSIGTALMYSQNATTGGTSITAKLLSKYFHIDFGKGLLISDSIVVLLALYTFGVELGLFGLISIYITGTLIDKLIYGFNLSKQIMIFTSREKLISNYIIKNISRGCTVFYGKGGFTGKNTCMVLTILKRSQFIKLKKFIKENDPKAFITVAETTEVLGKGFSSFDE
ncbi:YitT family protein [Clostridium sp. BJN0001]|uniref:YitT family protein n=1 Tax=Clostridium sp. BJN0001 TaxID=2930219 RepID=UPI001FD4BD9B|nr:YitT family protein [Clostridium sp. BJN0001]